MRTLLSLLFLLLPAALWAACSGTDLRQSLSPRDRAEISARVAALPYGEGNHWIASRGDRKIHVIGTLHLYDPRMEALTARLAPVIESADVLLVEADASAESKFLDTLARDPSLTLITDGPSLIDRLPKADWDALAQKARRHGIPPWMAAKMQPWFLSISMAVPPCLRTDGSKPEPGLDKRLEAQARAAGVPVGALEDPLTLLDIMGSDPLEDQVRELRAMLALLGTDRDTFHTMKESYFDEEAAFFLELNRRDFLAQAALPRHELEEMWQTTLAALTGDRNRAWMPVIEAAGGTRIVVAAGALHLPGGDGLLNLLAQAGYRLERAPF